MKITILVDNPNSWIMPYAKRVVEELSLNHQIYLLEKADQITEGDCVFLLSCEKLVKKDVLKKNKHNLVIHGSKLPEGKGWSPLTWRILEGENKIYLTLFEAVDKVDSGDIYFQESIDFTGSELIDELHQKEGEKIIDLIKLFCENYQNLTPKTQTGEETFYQRRTLKDSELDINKSILEQFNLLRIVDNDRYPAFFNHLGHKYIIKIYKDEN